MSFILRRIATTKTGKQIIRDSGLNVIPADDLDGVVTASLVVATTASGTASASCRPSS